MRIILLINSLGTGGAEFSTLSFYGWLKETTDNDIKIVCLKTAYPSYNLKDFGFSEISFLKDNFFLNQIVEFNQIVNDFKPDIVHSVLFESNLLARFCRMLKGFKHIESLVNQTYSPYRLKDPKVNILKLEFYRVLDFVTQYYGVDHFHSNGMTVAQHYHEKLFINKSRITNIPRGRKSNVYLNNKISRYSIRTDLKLEDKIVLINVARHEFQKAQTILLDAVNELCHLRNKIIVLLVGREGNATEEIKDRIKKYNLHDSVRVLGHRTDVETLLAAADIFIFPSRFEGLPGSLIEAEAAGLPIICSNIPNNLEVVKEGENALIFEVDNYLQLSHCIDKLVEDKKKREQMNKKSLAIFSERYEIDKVHKKMFTLLQEVLESKRGR